MNAVTLSNIQLNNPIFKAHFPSKPTFSKPSIRRRTLRRFIRRSSVVIDTGVDEPGQGISEQDEVETPSSATESVSRRLILLRHAKSSWRDRSLRGKGLPIWVYGSFVFQFSYVVKPLLNWVLKSNVFLYFFLQIEVDHDRPLSKTGQTDAIKVAHKLQELGWIPQLILSSDALRTRETLKIMQEHVEEFLEAEVRYVSSFYSVAAMDGQTAEHLQNVICRYSSDEIVTVMCMGHNRGWEEAASMFTGASVELKTCNAALLETTGKSWTEAFASAGLGGWKLQGIVKPSS